MTYLTRWFTLALSTLLLCATTQAAELEAIAKRLQVLEDREAIRSLIIAYGRAHDGRDYQAYAALFAKEGEWVSGMGTATGPAAIFEFLDKSIGHNPTPDSGTYHVMSNEQIDINGDRASAVTKWVYFTKNDNDTPNVTFLGHYVDQFIREDGQWKFLRRQSFRDIPTTK
jgi:uncharacterized protein (TIGR02246 family)